MTLRDPKSGLALDEHGNIKINPLVGYSTHSLPDACVLLALAVVPNAEALKRGQSQTVQVGIRAAQARELGEALLRSAEAAEMGQAPSSSKN